MTELAAPSRPADFSVGDVLSDTWTLYKRLFGRSALIAVAVVLPSGGNGFGAGNGFPSRNERRKAGLVCSGVNVTAAAPRYS